jgi:hypothetical protein
MAPAVAFSQSPARCALASWESLAWAMLATRLSPRGHGSSSSFQPIACALRACLLGKPCMGYVSRSAYRLTDITPAVAFSQSPARCALASLESLAWAMLATRLSPRGHGSRSSFQPIARALRACLLGKPCMGHVSRSAFASRTWLQKKRHPVCSFRMSSFQVTLPPRAFPGCFTAIFFGAHMYAYFRPGRPPRLFLVF